MSSSEEELPHRFNSWRRWLLGRRLAPAVVLLEPLGLVRERSRPVLVRCAFAGFGLARVGGRWLLMPGRLIRVLGVGGLPPEGHQPRYIGRLLRWRHVAWPEDGRLSVTLVTLAGVLRTSVRLPENSPPAPARVALEVPSTGTLRTSLPRARTLVTPKADLPRPTEAGTVVPPVQLRVPSILRARLRPPGT